MPLYLYKTLYCCVNRKMDVDRFPVQWQLLSSMVRGGCHLFHGSDLPDLQIQADESAASAGSFLLCRWAFGNVVLWHRQQAPDYEYTV